MATITNITLISGVIGIQQGTSNTVFYVGKRAKYTILQDNLTVSIQIDSHPSTDIIQSLYSNLRINGQTPSTLSEAQTLLNAVFNSTS